MPEQRTDRLGGAHHRRRVARAVGKEHPVGGHVDDLVRRRARRDNGDAGHPGQVAQDVALYAEVVGDHLERAIAVAVGARAGDLRHQVAPVRRRLGPGSSHQGGLVERAARRVDRPERPGHGPAVADLAGEAPGVDPGDACEAMAAQETGQGLDGAPVAGAAGELTHDDSPAEGPAALVVVGGDAVVADVGVGEGDHLAGVGRVGEHLLVTGHDRVEDDLAGGGRDGRTGPRAAVEPGAESTSPSNTEPSARASSPSRQAMSGSAHRCASSAITTGSPAKSVCRTLPMSSRPAKGVLWLRLARAAAHDHPAPGRVDHAQVGRRTRQRPGRRGARQAGDARPAART